MRQKTRAIVAFVVVASASSLAALYWYRPGVSSAELSAVVSFAVLSCIGALMPYSMSGAITGSATLVTLLASVILVPSWVSVLAASAVSALAQTVQRRPLTKAVFNVSQQALSLSLCIAAYLAVAGKGALSGGDVTVVALAGAFCAFFLANSVAVVAVVSAESGQTLPGLWREYALRGVMLDVITVPFAFVFAKVYLELGILATSAAAALIFIVRQLNSTNEELHKSNKELLELTVTTLEARDPYTSGHSRRVSEYAVLIGKAIALPARSIERLSVAALLHDVGKIHEVFAPILSKPGKLTAEERAVMESHPVKGAELVKISTHLRDTVEPIRHHHEAWDGSGYPDALSGEAIPLYARIIAIADTIDAMASDRPYRRGLSSEKIRGELIRMSGVQFDPELLSKLFRSGTVDAILERACRDSLNEHARQSSLAISAVG